MKTERYRNGKRVLWAEIQLMIRLMMIDDVMMKPGSQIAHLLCYREKTGKGEKGEDKSYSPFSNNKVYHYYDNKVTQTHHLPVYCEDLWLLALVGFCFTICGC